MFECRISSKKFPVEGETVIGKISSVSHDVVTMELLEYGNLSGLILSGELSKKRFKTVAQVTKVGNIEVCQVLKVEESTGFIDLSLKRVSDIEKQECKDRFNKSKLVYQIMSKVTKIAECSIAELYENWGYQKAEEHGTLFAYFSKAKDDLTILDNEQNGEMFKKVISDYFKASSFKVRIDVEVTCAKDGVNSIKKAFSKALEFDNELEIVLLKSPIFSIVKVSNDKEEAFYSVNSASELVKQEIERLGGEFSIINPARVYGEKLRHTLLGNSKQDEEEVVEGSDESDE